MKPAIRVENLSKRYRLGTHMAGDYRTLREAIVEKSSGVVRSIRNKIRQPVAGPGIAPVESPETFWALKDVAFEIEPGEVVGIIGRNGAGKSTLLKVLSRITEPTSGRMEIRGRVGSLLEVGTGFHPELTGRENVYLNGSILGMSRREIDRRFDEIVAFSEIEKFLDTPVKRYSSGMYVRLAFAVASHLETEILFVDEVLAVGDFAFQKKCLGKMSDVSQGGRTVLFVSHNTAAIEALCTRCILLSGGRMVAAGRTDDVLTEYGKVGVDHSTGRVNLTDHSSRRSTVARVMTEVVLGCDGHEPVSSIAMGSPLDVTVTFTNLNHRASPVLGIVIKTSLGAPLLGVNNRFIPGYKLVGCGSEGRVTCRFDRLPLMPGLYSLDLYFGDEHRDMDVVLDAIRFEITEADVFGSGKLPPHMAGPFYWPASWELRP